jgi:hypothetical protein
MTLVLAQNMPGMEWIPLMGLITIVGLLCGLTALLLRIFSSKPRAGRRSGMVAIGIGIGSVVLFLFLERSHLTREAYLILASPILPGSLSLAIRPRRRVRLVLRILCGVIAIGAFAGVAWSWFEKTPPPGVTAEEPAKYGWAPGTSIRNPFGLPPAVDAEGQLFSEAFERPAEPAANVTVDLPFLNDFAGPHRQLLLRHLATSAKWFVTRDMVDGEERLIATRRYAYSGTWLNSLNGYFDGGGKHFRIILGLDGAAYADIFRETATFARSNQGSVNLKVVAALPGSPLHGSYLVVTSSGATLEVYEYSARKDRPFTPVALSQLDQEFRAVLASAAARDHGFDPTLMPKESIRRGSPEMHLLSYAEEDGTYQVQAYVNPGESGYVYLKAFEGRGNSCTWGDVDYLKRKSTEYIGWSSDRQEQFFYNTEFDFGQPILSKTFAARAEIWFVPSSGAPERKLLEHYFNVK